MLIPPKGFEGWKIWTVGDDIAWIKPDATGRLRAINPEAGFFGVAPGTSDKTNPNAMATLAKNTIFTNVALTPDGGVWWEGMTDEPPAECIDWQGEQAGRRRSPRRPAPKRRIPTRASPLRLRSARPSIRPGKIRRACPSARMIFGGRRATTMPLVYQAFNWSAGVYIGATMGSETTAAAAGTVGKIRRDPMAMLPFCGYHMGDYFRHWIKMQRRPELDAAHLPRELVPQGRERQVHLAGLWREHARAEVDRRPRARPRLWRRETPIGMMPRYEDLFWTGLNFSKEQFDALQAFDKGAWKAEVASHEKLFNKLGSHLPEALAKKREELASKL